MRGNARTLVIGAGPTGLSCARLLSERGWPVDLSRRPISDCLSPAPDRALLLNEVAQHLLSELWQLDPAALEGAHPIRYRLVRWGAGQPSLQPHRSVAVSLQALREALAAAAVRGRVRFLEEEPEAGQYDWIVDAAGRASERQASARFGRRQAIGIDARLRPDVADDTCVLETVPGGWIIVIPRGGDRAAVQAVCATPFEDPRARIEALVDGGALVRERIDSLGSNAMRFDAMPRLNLDPLRDSRIAVGDCALALDPLSGEGIATGLRGAMLASAVLAALHDGRGEALILRHYGQRLRKAAAAHVRTCIDYYESADPRGGWRGECDAMRSALPWCGDVEAPLAFGLARL